MKTGFSFYFSFTLLEIISRCRALQGGGFRIIPAGLNPLRQRLPAAPVRMHGERGECPAGISNGVYIILNQSLVRINTTAPYVVENKKAPL